MILHLWRAMRCKLGNHARLRVVEQLSAQSQRIVCPDCGRQFAINHDVRCVLPWHEVAGFHAEMKKRYGPFPH